jgi:hypothetical protein
MVTRPARSTATQPRLLDEGEATVSAGLGRYEILRVDSFEWLRQAHERSVHAVVTDPP